MNSVYRDIRQVLLHGGMEEGEAKAVALLLLEKVTGLPAAKALIADAQDLNCPKEDLLTLAARIAQGEPVQYVLGEADFCGLTLKVNPSVLIPRPETEELVRWIKNPLCPTGISPYMGRKPSGMQAKRILDIGTGSGCIAIALQVAQENAERNGVKVNFRQVDVLGALEGEASFDIIVSNPPYICEEEAVEMEKNVLEHEPETALFVPNEDPLLFYRKIGAVGQALLVEGGKLFFEINRRFGKEVVSLLQGMGYQEVELRKDSWGNDRMVKAIKKKNHR